jgi:hypothetical protein
MTAGLAALRRVLPPPASPKVGCSEQRPWTRLERQLGLPFPPGYRDMVLTYGYGCIDRFLWVADPFRAGWFKWVALRMSALIELRAVHHGRTVPYALFPEPGGLFPWAFTDNGDTLYWGNAGARALVVVGAGREPEWDEFHGGPCAFLAALLGRTHVSPIFPGTFPEELSRFRSKRS